MADNNQNNTDIEESRVVKDQQKSDIPESRVIADQDNTPPASSDMPSDIPTSRVVFERENSDERERDFMTPPPAQGEDRQESRVIYDQYDKDPAVIELKRRVENLYKKEVIKAATSKDNNYAKKKFKDNPEMFKSDVFNKIADNELKQFAKTNPDKYESYKKLIEIQRPSEDYLANIKATTTESKTNEILKNKDLTYEAKQEIITQIQEETPFFDEEIYNPESSPLFVNIYDDPEIDYIFEQIEHRADAIYQNAKSQYENYLQTVRQQNKDALKLKGKPLRQKLRIILNPRAVRKEREIPKVFEEMLDTDVINYRLRAKAYEELKKINPQKAKAYKNQLFGVAENVEEQEFINPFSPSYDGNMPFIGSMSAQEKEKLKKIYGRKTYSSYGREIYRDSQRSTVFFNDPHNVNNIYDMEFVRAFSGQFGSSKWLGFTPNGYQIEKPQGKTLTDLNHEQYQKDKSAKPIKYTSEQSKQILRLVSEFQRKTQQTSGYEILIDEKGEVHLQIQGFRKMTKYSRGQRENINDLYKYLKENHNLEFKNKKEEKSFRNEILEGQSYNNPFSRKFIEKLQSQFTNSVDSELIFKRRFLFFKDKTRIIGYKSGTSHVNASDGEQGLFGKFSVQSTPFQGLFSRIKIGLNNTVSSIQKTLNGFKKSGKRGLATLFRKGITKTFGAIMTTLAPILFKVGLILGAIVGIIITFIIAILITVLYAVLTFVAFVLFAYFVLFIINNSAYVVPPGGFGANLILPPSTGDDFNCAVEYEALPSSFNNPSNPIANRAQQIVGGTPQTGLRRGFWCYWNHSPQYDDASDPADYFDEALFAIHPNHCVYYAGYPEGCTGSYLEPINLFWCTLLILRSYNETGHTMPYVYDGSYLTGSNAMKNWFIDQNRYIEIEDALTNPQANIQQGDVAIIHTHSTDPNYANHVALIWYADNDVILTIDANAGYKYSYYTITDNRDGAWLDGINIIGIGKQ